MLRVDYVRPTGAEKSSILWSPLGLQCVGAGPRVGKEIMMASGKTKALCLAVALLATCSSPVRAEYRIDIGDVLAFFVAGMPTLQRQMRVDEDGKISVPLAG